IPHADIVNGSRIVEQLQDRHTQLTLYMHYGNFFAGKLLELKHLGSVSLSDLGTTYKLCRNEPLRALLGTLDPRVNLEFNPYFLDMAIQKGMRILEVPVSFHPRVGTSKGGNVSNWIATKLGIRMILGLLFDWKGIARDG
ncbi:MAG: glycosyltransferase family 2 protein, partial [Verrucomicrobia bacterium]|nr:glycosyltransferase family 2 protein [Verrucomicrobiota bacterium]